MLSYDDQAGLSDGAKRLLLVDHLLEVRRLVRELTGEPAAGGEPLAAELTAERWGTTAMAATACEVIARRFGESLNDERPPQRGKESNHGPAT